MSGRGPYSERRKVPGASIEVRGSFGGYRWMLWSHGVRLKTGTTWTRKTAWRRAEQALEEYQPYL